MTPWQKDTAEEALRRMYWGRRVFPITYKFIWSSTGLAEDLKAFHNIDIIEETVKVLAKQMADKIDRDILERLKREK